MNEVRFTPQGINKLEVFELAPYLSPFTAKMKSVGFTSRTIDFYSAGIRHFGTWLHVNAICPSEITPATVECFSSHRCTCSGCLRKTCLSRKYVQRVKRFVDYLREINAVDDKSESCLELPPAWDRDGFTSWLINDRGLVAITVSNYVRTLTHILPVLGFNVQQYTAQHIHNVVCGYPDINGPGNAKQVTTALRSYLKFLVTQDLCSYSLIAAVPTVANWRLSSLPRYICKRQYNRVPGVSTCPYFIFHGMSASSASSVSAVAMLPITHCMYA